MLSPLVQNGEIIKIRSGGLVQIIRFVITGQTRPFLNKIAGTALYNLKSDKNRGATTREPFLKCYNAITGSSWMECSNKNAFQTCFSKYNHSEAENHFHQSKPDPTP